MALAIYDASPLHARSSVQESSAQRAFQNDFQPLGVGYVCSLPAAFAYRILLAILRPENALSRVKIVCGDRYILTIGQAVTPTGSACSVLNQHTTPA